MSSITEILFIQTEIQDIIKQSNLLNTRLMNVLNLFLSIKPTLDHQTEPQTVLNNDTLSPYKPKIKSKHAKQSKENSNKKEFLNIKRNQFENEDEKPINYNEKLFSINLLDNKIKINSKSIEPKNIINTNSLLKSPEWLERSNTTNFEERKKDIMDIFNELDDKNKSDYTLINISSSPAQKQELIYDKEDKSLINTTILKYKKAKNTKFI